MMSQKTFDSDNLKYAKISNHGRWNNYLFCYEILVSFSPSILEVKMFSC